MRTLILICKGPALRCSYQNIRKKKSIRHQSPLLKLGQFTNKNWVFNVRMALSDLFLALHGDKLKNELPQTLDQTVQELNKHLHEMLKRLPHLSAARVKHHYESFLLPFQIRGNLLASGKKKERKNEKRKRSKNRKETRGNPAWSMIYLWNQENSSPLKWYFS